MKGMIAAGALLAAVAVGTGAMITNAGFAAGDQKREQKSEATSQVAGPLSFVVKDIKGNDYDLSQLKGKVVMIVNVASECGNTPQYEALEKLYEQHKDEGLVILGFPANNFGGQEPGSNEEIQKFCTSKYSVTFPMMSKISVKGDDKAPLYKYLTDKSTGGEFAGEVKWNFAKFLVGKDGKVVARFDPKTKPDSKEVTKAVEHALAASA